MLELRRLTAGYGNDAVLHGIDLAVAEGRITALIGANGAGKSTLAKTISGLLPARDGQILFEGAAIETLSSTARVELGIVHVPEGRQIIGSFTVEENLRLGAYLQRRALGERGIAARIDEVCGYFPVLRERLGGVAGNLSGGQQQMLAIARALMLRPRLIVLDEPSLGLSPALVTEIFALVTQLRDRGLAVLLSEQNARMSLAIADHAYVLETGRVTLEGPGRELLARPEIAERYLGVAPQGDEQSTAAEDRAMAEGLARILAV
ncbi:MAG: transporter family protein [Rhodospirillales bacterium]|nr:transporter family protein [Rhodospirillales bacterium]